MLNGNGNCIQEQEFKCIHCFLVKSTFIIEYIYISLRASRISVPALAVS
jgi:hypothetical protein